MFQRIIHKLKVWAFPAAIAVPILWGATTLTSVALKNSSIVTSTIDSTPIGSTSPSTGHFTSVLTTGSQAYNLNGAYLNWSRAGAQESNFINRGSPGGFSWYQTTDGILGGAIMTLDTTGHLTTANGFGGNLTGNASTATFANNAGFATSAGNASTANQLTNTPPACFENQVMSGIQANGAAICSSWSLVATTPSPTILPPQGAYIAWNTTIDGIAPGYMDFIDQPGIGDGGWSWRSAASGNVDLNNPVAILDLRGNMIAKGSFQLGNNAGPKWTTGGGNPGGSCVNGSLYSQTASGQLFVCQGGGWVGK